MYQNSSHQANYKKRPRSLSRNFRPSRPKPKKSYIHPSRFIKDAKPTQENIYQAQHCFEDFMLNRLIKKNLSAMGYQKPSPIQDQSIPFALEGRDIVGIADTGTGKTAAFGVPILNKLIEDRKSKALILAPTRELAQQIDEQCRKIAKGSGLEGALLIGGTPMRLQHRDLKHNPRIIIGTPGRTLDHLKQGSLNISDCNLVVLDEVDRMLDMGFVGDITEILDHITLNHQSFYFSATLDERVKKIINNFSHNPHYISIKSDVASDNVDQNVINYSGSKNKIIKLQEVLLRDGTSKAIIFDDTQIAVEKLSRELSSLGFSADSIHGGKSQPQRQQVLNRFKKNQVTILVATDVASRGLDVADITHVINYSLPQSYADYVHRIGRTGRAGKTGCALTFVENHL